MELKDISTIQRALGMLEGVAFAVDDNVKNTIFTAVEMIDAALNMED